MIVALILLGAIVAVGAILWAHDRLTAPSAEVTDDTASDNGASADSDSVCCGMHLQCEKDSLAISDDTIVYFDDEELDRFAGRLPGDYLPHEADQFRDVMLTMLPSDIAPWARSLQLRGVALPADVRDELLMIVAEARTAGATE